VVKGEQVFFDHLSISTKCLCSFPINNHQVPRTLWHVFSPQVLPALAPLSLEDRLPQVLNICFDSSKEMQPLRFRKETVVESDCFCPHRNFGPSHRPVTWEIKARIGPFEQDGTVERRQPRGPLQACANHRPRIGKGPGHGHSQEGDQNASPSSRAARLDALSVTTRSQSRGLAPLSSWRIVVVS
jgi:hypothetical protein